LYVYCNIETLSPNHFCHGKVISIKYMSVCLNYFINYPACKSRVLCVILSPVACPAISYFSTLSMNGMIFGGVFIESKMFVLIFCTALLGYISF